MDSPRDDIQSLPEGIDGYNFSTEPMRALVLTMMSERDALALERDTLQTQNDRLRHLLLQLRRLHFGPRSERLPEEQLQLGFEAIEQAIAKAEAEGGEARSRAAQGQCRQAACQPRRTADAPAADRGDAGARRHRVPVLPGGDDGDRRGHVGASRCDPGAVSCDCD